MKRKKKSVVKKILSRLVFEAIVGAIFAVAYQNRELIGSAIKGEELPKAP